jgi:hypothetical protein
MVHIIKALAVGILAGIANAFNYDQPYRGQYHFSPQENWINDPSGLLYHARQNTHCKGLDDMNHCNSNLALCKLIASKVSRTPWSVPFLASGELDK